MAIDTKGCEFTLNLISNASMETFPGNRLSSFTTLLSEPFNLPGEWQVALVELSWPAMIRNVTEGQITVSKSLDTPKASSTLQNPRRSTGLVSMTVPKAFRSSNVQFTAKETKQIKTGCYSSIDSILKSIFKTATDGKVKLHPSMSGKTNEVSKTGLPSISWKVDCATEELQVKFVGNVKTHGLVIKAKSQDLKNILGTTTLIDCQSDASAREQPSERGDDDCRIVKHEGQWPIDLNGGSHTMFVYCDLVQNETLGDVRTALLRSVPLESLSNSSQKRREVNHRSFTNLQWKRVYKSQFQSITLSLANEIGQTMPFLSCGRTNITLALRPKPL